MSTSGEFPVVAPAGEVKAVAGLPAVQVRGVGTVSPPTPESLREAERLRAEAAAQVANGALEQRLQEQERAREAAALERDRQAKAFRPVGAYLLVRQVVREASTGGIVLPDAKKEQSGHGVVLAVGPEVKEIEVGMHLWFSRYCGASVEFPDGVTDARYRIVAESEVFGAWGPEEAAGVDVASRHPVEQ